MIREVRAPEELVPGAPAARLKPPTHPTNPAPRLDYFAHRQAGYIIGSGASNRPIARWSWRV